MSSTLVDKVAEAVLYEGYILYPYRVSSKKNRERFTFGRIYPEDYSEAQHGGEAYIMQTECVARRMGDEASITGRVRFLQPMAREVCTASRAGEARDVVAELLVGTQMFQTWHEAVERDIAIPEIPLGVKGQRLLDFYFPGTQTEEKLYDADGMIAGIIRRRQHAMAGDIVVAVEPMEGDASKVTVRISNRTPMPEGEVENADAVLLSTCASTHTILRTQKAEFISLTDPPADYALATTRCENVGTWPVLVGDEALEECDTMLSSPIILYDYPQIAPESAGDLCDGLEIDEMLTLRMLTMTDDEKAEMRSVDAYARRMLERTESLREEDLMKMHGTMRDVQFPGGGNFFDESDANARLESACVGGVWLQPGDRVRIKPKNRADAIDMMLAGKIAVIEAIEQDAEERIHLALVMEDDPGRDLGMMRKPGHRFFYEPDEVEIVEEE